MLDWVCPRTLLYGVSDLGRCQSQCEAHGLMLCPSHTSLHEDWVPSHQRADAVMVQKTRLGRPRARLHSTPFRHTLDEHVQCHISVSTVLVQEVHVPSQYGWPGTSNVRAKGWCLLYKAVTNAPLTWASSTKKLSDSPREFPCMLKFMRCIREG